MLLHIFARRFSLKRCVFPRLVSVEGKTWSPGRTYVVIRMMTVRNVLRMRARVRVRVCMCAGAREGEGERVCECVFVCFIVKNPDGLSKRRLGFSPGLVAFHGKWAFYYLGGGAVRVSSQAKQSLYSSLATLLWHRGPVTKSVTRANLARAAGPAAHAHRVPIAVGGRIRIPQESFPTGAGVGTGLPSRSPATPSLVPGWKAGGWSSRQIHQPGAARTL